jgi:cell division protease FtsH
MLKKNKFFTFFRLHWLAILLYSCAAAAVITTLAFIFFGFTNFASLESFSRKSLMAQLGLFFLSGLLQVFFFSIFGAIVQYYIFMGGGMSKMLGGDSAEKAKSDVLWDEVIGMEEAKRDAWEIVQFIKDSKKVKSIGGTMIKGVLMVGPPGCGKTYLAKAMASEAGLPFLSAVGSEFVGMIVGIGAARMKSLFRKARKMAEMHGGCIIFIDEIDSFARPRTQDMGGGGMISNNATINQFLTELDGLRKKENNLVVLAATNVPEEQLDSAIMRSGRFDRKIYIQKPNSKEREALIKFYLSKVTAENSVNIPELADKAKWFSPADINNMVREAAVIALRDRRETITQTDLEKGLDKVMTSIEKMGGDKILSSKVNVQWDSVIGMESAKKEAWEIVELLRDRNRLKAVGGRIVKGVMMMGPPGCGKTYLAKAMATEAGFPFISASGSEFIEMYVGVGAKRVRELFKEARLLARAEGGCLIFIDEIDAIGRPRGFDGSSAGSEYNSTINQLLTEMDGLRQDDNNIVVLAATNASERDLDSALMRAGRFDRKIYVTTPNLEERIELFKFYLSKVKTDESVKPEILGRKTLWFTPADISNMVREAGIFALRDNRDFIIFKDLSQAYDRVSFGNKSNVHLSEKEKEWVAYHEAGHAIITYLLHPTDDVIKATIIPHKNALGFVAPRSREEIHIRNKEWYLASIKVVLASYAAEKIKFGTTGSGVSGDFQTAMNTAHHMVWSWGMGKSGFLGDMDQLMSHHGRQFISDKTREKLDEDVQEILQTCLKDVTHILMEKRALLDTFAQELLKKGELEYDEIEAIFQKFGLQSAAQSHYNKPS